MIPTPGGICGMYSDRDNGSIVPTKERLAASASGLVPAGQAHREAEVRKLL